MSKHLAGSTHELWRCQYQTQNRLAKVVHATWSPEGSLYALAHGRSVSLWQHAGDKLLHTFTAHRIDHVTFGGNDGDVLAASGSGGLVAWSLLTYEGKLFIAGFNEG